MTQLEQITELLGFLHDRNPTVRQLAIHGFLPFTLSSSPSRSLLPTPAHKTLPVGSLDPTIIQDLKSLCEDQHTTAHDAFSALINLSDTQPVAEQLCDPDFLSVVYFVIIDHSSLLADLACMLLSNLTKFQSIVTTCLTSAIPAHSSHPSFQQDEGLSSKLKKSSTPVVDLLVEIFARGDQKQLNPNANFDFLGSVWANFAAFSDGRNYLVGAAPFTTTATEAPLFQLSPFTEHPSLIRRGGVISAIKNCCFATEVHDRLLSPSGFNLLPAILLPLIGPEAPDDPAEEEDFPPECQLLGPDKRRETDANLRLILVEALTLLATFPSQRDILRAKKVYRIVQLTHLNESSDPVQEAIERLVNLLMRDEEPTQRISETPQTEEEEEEEQLVEV